MGLLSPADVHLLERYARMWQMYQDLQKDPKKSATIAIRLHDRLMKIEKELGLTPAARNGLAPKRITNEHNAESSRGRKAKTKADFFRKNAV